MTHEPKPVASWKVPLAGLLIAAAAALPTAAQAAVKSGLSAPSCQVITCPEPDRCDTLVLVSGSTTDDPASSLAIETDLTTSVIATALPTLGMNVVLCGSSESGVVMSKEDTAVWSRGTATVGANTLP